MNISESEKNRIRGLHKQYSIIKEDKSWGGNKGDESKSEKDFEEGHETEFNELWGSDVHKSDDVDGHYKTYESHDGELDEDYDEFNEDFDEIEKGDMVTEDTEGEETYNYGEDEGEDRKEEDDLEAEEGMTPYDRIDAIQKHLDALRKDMAYDEDHEDRGEEGDDFE